MDTSVQIEKWKNLMEKKYAERILSMQKHLIIDYSDIIQLYPELDIELNENPEECLKCAEIALENVLEKAFGKKEKKYPVRIKNHDIIKPNVFRVRDINKDLTGKLISIKGIIKSYSSKIKVTTAIRYECHNCAKILRLIKPRHIKKFEPKCSCGTKRMYMLSKDEIDERQAILEEDPENLGTSSRPEQIKVLIQDTILYSEADEILGSGMQVTITGILKDEPIFKNNNDTGDSRYVLEANYIKVEQDEFINYRISKEDEKLIKHLSKQDDIFDKFINVFANHLYGLKEVKQAIILQMFGGVTKYLNPKQTQRGQINILLLGDPASGKSRITKSILEYCPRSRYSSGGGMSGVGLTASAKKDELINDWVVEPGAMVLANNSIAILDEFDKLGEEEKGKLHEAMSEGTISIDKANIHATLKCNTAVLCSANPKHGRFFSFSNLGKEINLPSALISRFDIIMIIKDVVEETKDRDIVRRMLKTHTKNYSDDTELLVSKEIFKKYIIYAKKHINPELTPQAKKLIEEYYINLRNKNNINKQDFNDIKDNPVSATPRDVENIIRSSEAVARLHFSKYVEVKHVEKAIEILSYFKNQIYKEIGISDNSIFETGKPTGELVREIRFDDIICNLPLNTPMEEEEIIQRAVNEGINITYAKRALSNMISKDKVLSIVKDGKLIRVM